MGLNTNSSVNTKRYEPDVACREYTRHSVTRRGFVVIFLLALTLAFVSREILHTILPVNPPIYPDLYEASIKELQSGLDKNQFTSVDLVKVSFRVIDSGL